MIFTFILGSILGVFVVGVAIRTAIYVAIAKGLGW